MRHNSAECFIGTADGVFRARKVRRLEPQMRWDKEAVNNVIGVPWRMNDRQQMDSGQTRNSRRPRSFSSCAIRCCTESEGKNNQSRHSAIRSHCRMPRLQYAIKDNTRAQAHSDLCRERSTRRWLQKVRRAEQRKRRVRGNSARTRHSHS